LDYERRFAKIQVTMMKNVKVGDPHA